jgi:histidine triad (HIT) family protein
MECIFCKIVAGKAPATVVRRFSNSIIIRPLEPVTEGHVLVIPHKHVSDYTEDMNVTALTASAASAYARTLNTDSNLITSAGTIATQSVFHLHMHVVPRRRGDGLKLPWSGKNFR